MKRTPLHKNSKRGFAASLSVWLILLFLILPADTALPEDTALAEEPPPARAVSSTRDPEGMSRSSLVEELYLNYEAIDRELGHLTDAVLGLKGGHTLVPLTITVKKEKGIKLLSIEITDDGEPLWTHKYSTLENSALDRGSSQLFYRGAASKDTHTLAITYEYVSAATGVGMGKYLESELDVIGDALYVEITIKETDNGVEAVLRELDFLGTE